jgi:proteasome accessory factor A
MDRHSRRDGRAHDGEDRDQTPPLGAQRVEHNRMVAPVSCRAPRLTVVDRRIFGLENEYGVTCTFRGQRRLSPDEVARYLFRRVVSWGRSSNVFLKNGARLYLDVGSHPEYATPECDDVIELVAHDKAGERTLEGLLMDAERRLREEGIAGDIYLFKNNTDSAGNSYGCHENYLVGRHGEFSRLADVLIPFLVTRQIICGAGKVLLTPRGAVYCVSQRAEHIWEGVSSATTRSRPIINTRDEPHADAERFRRLHVIVGDSNMSETTTMLKIGTTDLVLRMIEAGIVMRDLSLENAIRAIREVSHDVTGRRKVKLANGREASALEIQQEYFVKARDFVQRRGGDATTEKVLELWERTLKAVDTGDLALVEREVDWVTKYQLIERYRAKHDMQLSSPRVAQLDLAYHDVNRRRGLYYLLERRGAVERVTTDLKIFEAKSVPPQTTRARLRGDFIRHAQEKRRDFTVDWVHLKLNDQAQRTVLCKDPFRSVDDRVEKLIASM